MPITINDCKCGADIEISLEWDWDRNPQMFVQCLTRCDDGHYFKSFSQFVKEWNEASGGRNADNDK